MSRVRQPRVKLDVHPTAISHNYRALLQLSGGVPLLPMVKANAYGHDWRIVSRSLHSQKKLRGLGVATVDEAVELRKTLSSSIPIMIFSETALWQEAGFDACLKHKLTPVLSDLRCFKSFVKNPKYKKLPYHLKFNTGMNRLGMELREWEAIRTWISQKKHDLPEGVATHLAESESPRSPLSRQQLKLTLDLHRLTKAWSDKIEFHYANSGAIARAKDWQIKKLSQFARPGLSLYGVEPWPRSGLRKKLKLAMTVQARVLSVQTLDRGDRVGYGGTYRAKSKERVAIVGAGYADGLFRSLSNRGQAWHRGKRRNYRGRISMDLSAIECGPSTQAGDWVELFGPHLDPWDLAAKAGTIPYEILTSWSSRVKR